MSKNELIKGIGWLYLVAFALFQILNAISATLWSGSSATGLFLVYLPLVNVLVFALYLKKNKAHFIWAVVGASSLLPTLLDAHEFSDLGIVTPLMYLSFLPMLLIVGFVIYEGVKRKT